MIALIRIVFCILVFLFPPWGGQMGAAQKNLTFRSRMSMTGSGCSGYVDGMGREYALIGNGPGLSIVNITDPDNPVKLFTVPGYCYVWTEVKTWGNYAYFTSDGCSGSDTTPGLVIINLSNLPANINYKTWKGNGAIANQLHKCHTLQIENGYAYLNGCTAGGMVILDLSDPWNPNYLGKYNTYVHDCFVHNDTAWTAEIYKGTFAVVNVADKSNPVFITEQMTPSAFTHNVALSDDSKYIFTTDEIDNAYLASYDVSVLSDIKELDRYRPSEDTSGEIEVHNTYFLNNYLVNANYSNNVTILDATRPDNLIEVARYEFDSVPCPQFSGCITWDVYPYLPSGNIIASDFDKGMIILTPTYKRACYLEGNVTDSLTGNPLFKVKMEILSTPVKDSSKLNGTYKTGYSDAGTYSVKFSKAGYIDKIIPGVVLSNGDITALNVQLWDGTTGMPEMKDAGYKILIYPNPGNGDFRFSIRDFPPEAGGFINSIPIVIGMKINDVFGREVFSATSGSARGGESLILNPNSFIHLDLPSGIYFYMITDDRNAAQTGKLVLQ